MEIKIFLTAVVLMLVLIGAVKFLEVFNVLTRVKRAIAFIWLMSAITAVASSIAHIWS